mgnify:CR=1 FL=1
MMPKAMSVLEERLGYRFHDSKLLETVVKRYIEIDVWNQDINMKQEDYERLIEIITQAGIITTSPSFDEITASEFWS